MGAKDWMWLEIDLVDMAEVYVSYGKDYEFESRSASRATFGKKFAILKGKDYYVSSWALKLRRAYFRLKTWIEVWEDEEDERVIRKEVEYGEGYNEYVPPETDPEPEQEDQVAPEQE